MALQQQQQSLQQQRQQLMSQLQQQEEQHKHDIAALQEELHEQHTSSTKALKCLSDNALKQLATLQKICSCFDYLVVTWIADVWVCR